MKKIHHATAKVMIRELEHKMAMLRQSDDRLFSNKNGNLPTYDGWAEEVRELERNLPANRLPKKPTPYNPQTDTKVNF